MSFETFDRCLERWESWHENLNPYEPPYYYPDEEEEDEEAADQ